MAIYSFYDNHCDQFDGQLQLFENDENSPKYDNVAAAASSFDDEELLTIKSWLLAIGSNAKGVTLNVTVTLSGYCSIAEHDDNNNKHNTICIITPKYRFAVYHTQPWIVW